MRLDKTACRHKYLNKYRSNGFVHFLLATAVLYYADVAQLAEQLICNQQVMGSSPFISFTYYKK